MKKIVLSLAGALAATAFAPEAAAVPAFARQVGMGCTACHAQHFPILNSFGRAFKAGGYTMMGAQGKVEGEHLSIPDTLNASIVMKIRHQATDISDNRTGSKTSETQAVYDAADAAYITKEGQWQFFDEFALLFGGRVAENVGFLLEAQMIDPDGPFAAGFRMPFVFDMGAAKVSVVPFTTDALSVQYGYEQSSGGVMRSNRWAEHRRDISAIQYNADRGRDGGAATGVAFAVQNDMGFINVSKYAATQGGDSTLGSTYIRVAATPTVAGWAMVVGAGNMSGQSYTPGEKLSGTTGLVTIPAGAIATEQTFVDFQAQGEVAGKELGVYAQWATAPVAKNGMQNAYNGETKTTSTTATQNDRSAFSIGADYSVIPRVLSVGAAYRTADTGRAISVGNVRGAKNDAITVTAVYDLYQNVALHLNYSMYSGSDTNRTAADQADPTKAAQKSLTTFMLEAAW